MSKFKNIIITVIFVFILFYFFINSVFTCFKKFKTKNINSKINYEKIYPHFQKNKQKNSYICFWKNKYNKIKDTIASIERGISNSIPYKYKICELQMILEKYIGKNIFLEYDGTVVLNNKYLDYWFKTNSITKALQCIQEFNNFIKNKSDFIFVMYPSKNSKYDNQLPIGLKDNNNKTSDQFLNSLNINNIKTLDLREKVLNDYSSQYEMFFVTDHHWKPSAGLWAAKEICKELNNSLKWEIDISLLNKSKFQNIILPNYFLGTQGKKLTLSYAKTEDFEIIEPLYETSFQRICPEWSETSGTFKEVMFSEKYLEELNIYDKFTYKFYLNGDMSYLRLINNSNKAINKKVLLIRDSFNSVVSPFLSLCIKDLTMLDVRYFSGSVKTLLLKEKYDLVIIAYNSNCLVYKGLENKEFLNLNK